MVVNIVLMNVIIGIRFVCFGKISSVFIFRSFVFEEILMMFGLVRGLFIMV